VIAKKICRSNDIYQVDELQFLRGVAKRETVRGAMLVLLPLPCGDITSMPIAQQQQSRCSNLTLRFFGLSCPFHASIFKVYVKLGKREEKED
jgi:hypothetical protein